MSTENCRTNENHRFRLKLSAKINLKPSNNNNMVLANLSIYYTWKNVKSAYNNNKFKISATTWNDEFDLSDGSCSISDIQDYFEYIIEKHEAIADILSVQIYTNKIKNRIAFKIKAGYKLELLSPETMKLLGSTKKDIDQDKDGEDAPKLESIQVVLVHCNSVNNNYQQESIQQESIQVVLVHCYSVNNNYYLHFYQINNLGSQLICHLIH